MRSIPEKLSFVLCCWAAALVLPVPFQLLILLVVLLFAGVLPAFRPVSAIAAKSYRRFLSYAVLLAVTVTVLNGILTRSSAEPMRVGPALLDPEGVSFGIRVSSRLILMTASVLLFFVSTPLRALARWLEDSGVPTVLTSVLLLSLNVLERIPARVDQIFTAQESRGAPVREGLWARMRSIVAVLGPLVLSAVVESIERSHALELRGFHLRRRSFAPPLPHTQRSVTMALVIVSALLLVYGLWQALSR